MARLVSLVPEPLRAVLRPLLRWLRHARVRTLRAANARVKPRFVNVGSGKGAEALRWWTGDVQEGVLFDESYVFPIESDSIEVVFSSMFFEHIDDPTADQLLGEFRRILRPGGLVRIIVPNFWEYRRRYLANDTEYFTSYLGPNLETWKVCDVPVDLEHMLVSAIATVDNLPHEMVLDPTEIDLDASPPLVGYPVQNYLDGYYCGPPPGLTTEEIRQQFASLPYEDFLRWVFSAAISCPFASYVFNGWHKNFWDLGRLEAAAERHGFARVEASSYGALQDRGRVFARIEKPGHERLGLYFNLYS